MGGNALKEGLTERKTATAYHALAETVRRNAALFCSRAEIIPSYEEKLSFGDLDIVVSSDLETEPFKAQITEKFQPSEIVKNGPCWSFDHARFQIDLIEAEPEDFEATFFYFSYNDLNNLVGRTARGVGLKFGHLGLIAPVVVGSETKEIALTKKPEEIYGFLGYDHGRFKRGFKNLEEIFEFVTSSELFDPSDFGEGNHKSRTRNAKRKTYNVFLEWLESRGKTTKAENPTKRNLVEIGLTHFGKREVLEGLKTEEDRREQIRRKFNGERVSRLTGLKTLELGGFLAEFKHLWKTRQALDEWLLATPQEEIDRKIKNEAVMRRTTDMS